MGGVNSPSEIFTVFYRSIGHIAEVIKIVPDVRQTEPWGINGPWVTGTDP